MRKIKRFFARFFSFVEIDMTMIFVLVIALFLEEIRIYLLFFVFILMHEMCHYLCAKRYGYLPRKLKISIFGAALEGYDDFLPHDEIKIILSGPMFNLFVVVSCYLSYWFYPESFEFLDDILFVNKMILLFNLVPVFPLDAGRIMLCLLASKNGRNKAIKQTKSLSFLLIILLFIFSLIMIKSSFAFSLGAACINLGVLLFEGNKGTSFKREVCFSKKMQRLGNGIVLKTICVPESCELYALLKFLNNENYAKFVFVDENFVVKRVLFERELLEILGFIN